MGSLWSSSQSMLVFLKAPFLVLLASFYTLIIFLMMFSLIFSSMLMLLLLLKCDQNYDLGQHFEFASKYESDLRVTLIWSNKWLVNFCATKTQLVSSDNLKNSGALYVKMDGTLMKSYLWRCYDCLSPVNWISVLTLSLLLKLLLKKIRGLNFFYEVSFSRSCAFISINLSSGFAWSTVTMPRLVLLIATWICWISCRNGYVWLLVLLLLLLLQPWFIFRM